MIVYENSKVCIDKVSDRNYEVMVKRYHKKDVYIKDRKIKSKGDVNLPSTSEWGQYGFTYTDKASAYDKALRISLGV